MIINERYFSHPSTRIAGIETVDNAGRPAGPAARIIEDIHTYISRLEPKFLRMLLGEEVANNIEQYPQILRLLVQPDAGTSVIAKYIYFYYTRDHATFNTVAGEKIKLTDNSRNVSPGPRLVGLWNEMVEECCQIVESIDDVELSPAFDSEIFEWINSFNL